jgi:hypothetical protein
MNQVREELSSGIHCDFCHKVGGVYLNPIDKQIYPNVPGVLAMNLLRPPEDEQIFIGPYPDIHDPDTYHPVFSQSDFCAPCHQFSFWGTEIYNSYGEWLESDYASEGVTCQDCHMAPSGEQFFALPEQGGLAHPPEIIPSHFQLGIKDVEFMQSTLEMDVLHQITDGQFHLQVTLTNATAGHHVPTDHPGRHLILVVHVYDAAGDPVSQLQGPVIPTWVGDYAGEAGVVYAKVLEDANTGEYPVVDYWKPTLIHSDNRLSANENRDEEFYFDLQGDSYTVSIKVFFRRMFQPIAESYDWELSEILLTEEIITIQP